jgi:hypothetical protein
MTESNYIWYNYCVRLHKDPNGEHRGIFASDSATEKMGAMKSYCWDNAPSEQYGGPSLSEILFVGSLEVIERVVESS